MPDHPCTHPAASVRFDEVEAWAAYDAVCGKCEARARVSVRQVFGRPEHELGKLGRAWLLLADAVEGARPA